MGRPLRLLAVLAICVTLATATSATAQPTPPTVEDQHDRWLRNLRAEQAERTATAVELFRSGERNLVPASDIIGDVAAPPPARPVPAVPRPGVGVVASLLLGLVGDVVGGCAALATAAVRRRLRQPASAT